MSISCILIILLLSNKLKNKRKAQTRRASVVDLARGARLIIIDQTLVPREASRGGGGNTGLAPRVSDNPRYIFFNIIIRRDGRTPGLASRYTRQTLLTPHSAFIGSSPSSRPAGPGGDLVCSAYLIQCSVNKKVKGAEALHNAQRKI